VTVKEFLMLLNKEVHRTHLLFNPQSVLLTTNIAYKLTQDASIANRNLSMKKSEKVVLSPLPS